MYSNGIQIGIYKLDYYSNKYTWNRINTRKRTEDISDSSCSAQQLSAFTNAAVQDDKQLKSRTHIFSHKRYC